MSKKVTIKKLHQLLIAMKLNYRFTNTCDGGVLTGVSLFTDIDENIIPISS